MIKGLFSSMSSRSAPRARAATLLATLVGFMALLAAGLVTAPASAAPVGAGSLPAAQQATAGTNELLSTVRYHRRYYGRRPYYGRPVYRRPIYARPYYRRCRVVPQRVWTGYAWRVRSVRVCR
jgi:hypothetical protein